MASERLFGYGIGVFLIAFIWAITFLLCIAFARAQGGKRFVAIAIFLVGLIITLCLLFIPREPKDLTAESFIIYDYYFFARLILLIVLALTAVGGFLAYTILFAFSRIEGRPLKKANKIR